MSQYSPSLDNLLLTVEQFLVQLTPSLQGDQKYKSQVSAFLLGVCRRELTAGGSNDFKDLAICNALTGCESATPLEGRRLLCARIRDGALDQRFDDVVNALLERTRDDVAIVQPNHLAAGRGPSLT